MTNSNFPNVKAKALEWDRKERFPLHTNGTMQTVTAKDEPSAGGCADSQTNSTSIPLATHWRASSSSDEVEDGKNNISNSVSESANENYKSNARSDKSVLNDSMAESLPGKSRFVKISDPNNSNLMNESNNLSYLPSPNEEVEDAVNGNAEKKMDEESVLENNPDQLKTFANNVGSASATSLLGRSSSFKTLDFAKPNFKLVPFVSKTNNGLQVGEALTDQVPVQEKNNTILASVEQQEQKPNTNALIRNFNPISNPFCLATGEAGDDNNCETPADVEDGGVPVAPKNDIASTAQAGNIAGTATPLLNARNLPTFKKSLFIPQPIPATPLLNARNLPTFKKSLFMPQPIPGMTANNNSERQKNNVASSANSTSQATDQTGVVGANTNTAAVPAVPDQRFPFQPSLFKPDPHYSKHTIASILKTLNPPKPSNLANRATIGFKPDFKPDQRIVAGMFGNRFGSQNQNAILEKNNDNSSPHLSEDRDEQEEEEIADADFLADEKKEGDEKNSNADNPDSIHNEGSDTPAEPPMEVGMKPDGGNLAADDGPLANRINVGQNEKNKNIPLQTNNSFLNQSQSSSILASGLITPRFEPRPLQPLKLETKLDFLNPDNEFFKPKEFIKPQTAMPMQQQLPINFNAAAAGAATVPYPSYSTGLGGFDFHTAHNPLLNYNCGSNPDSEIVVEKAEKEDEPEPTVPNSIGKMFTETVTNMANMNVDGEKVIESGVKYFGNLLGNLIELDPNTEETDSKNIDNAMASPPGVSRNFSEAAASMNSMANNFSSHKNLADDISNIFVRKNQHNRGC